MTSKKITALYLLLLSLVVFIPGVFAHAEEVTLAWKPGPGEVTGYRIYCSTRSAVYSSDNIDVGNVTEYTVTGLHKSTTYYFVVRAYNSYGESGNSNEVRWPPFRALYFPHVAVRKGWDTEIAVINTSDNRSLSGTLVGIGNDGREVESMSFKLYARARREIRVSEAFNDLENISYMVFMSDSDDLCGYSKFYVEGKYRAALPAVLRINEGDIHIPHIASSAEWTTAISLVNTTSFTRALKIEFDNGQTDTIILWPGHYFADNIRNFPVFGGEPQPGIGSAVIKNADGIVGFELFSCGNCLAGILLSDNISPTIYYPHVVSNDTWYTTVVAYNPSDIPCNIGIASYSRSGALLGSKVVSVDGKSRYIGMVRNLGLPADTAWLRFDAPVPVAGFELFMNHDRTQLAGYACVDINIRQGVFSKLDRNGGTGIAFVNTEGMEASVILTAYSNTGVVVATGTEYLAPYEKLVKTAEDFFADDISSATYIGFSSNREVAGSQFNVSVDGMMLDALSVM